MGFRVEKNEKGHTIDIRADGAGGKGEIRIPVGRRDLLHYASIAAAGALWLHGKKARRERSRALAQAERSLSGPGKGGKRRGKFKKR